jgi:hypothetical protein
VNFHRAIPPKTNATGNAIMRGMLRVQFARSFVGVDQIPLPCAQIVKVHAIGIEIVKVHWVVFFGLCNIPLVSSSAASLS